MYHYGCFDPDHACLAEDDGSEDDKPRFSKRSTMASFMNEESTKAKYYDAAELQLQQRFKTEREVCLRPDDEIKEF